MAGLLRTESYPPVFGVDFLDSAPSVDDAAPCVAAESQGPWTRMTSPGEARLNLASALRPGAERLTCNGGILQTGYQPQMSHMVHEPRFVCCDLVVTTGSGHRGPQPNALHWSLGDMGSPAAAAPMSSPFSAPARQFLIGGAEVAMAAGDAHMDWPAPPAGQTADTASGVGPSRPNLVARPPGRQLHDSPLLARPALTFSEHPCSLLRSLSDGRESLQGAAGPSMGAGPAADVLQPHFSAAPTPAPLQGPAPCQADSSAEPCEASAAAAAAPAAPAPSAAAPAASAQPSLDRYSGVKTSSADVGAEPEVISAASPPPPAPAPAAPTAAEPVAIAVRAPKRSRFAPAPAAPPPPPAPTARGTKRRAAAAAAAAVVKVAARDAEDDDEDYDESENESGSSGGRGAKRAKKSGPRRQTVGRLVRGVTCRNCGATQTPQWRCGPEGPRTLCNACGVRFKKGHPLAYMEHKKRQMGL